MASSRPARRSRRPRPGREGNAQRYKAPKPTPGAVVEYHGTYTDLHGRHYVMEVANDGRLTIADWWYPEFTLSNVSPESVTATDVWVTLCECGHRVGAVLWEGSTHCAARNCPCEKHHQDDEEQEAAG